MMQIRKCIENMFVHQWNLERKENKKLGFYNMIKNSFQCETYLSSSLSYKQSKKITELRTSSHRFNIETGRHGHERRKNITHRVCLSCCNDKDSIISDLAEMPFFNPIIEDEVHVLRSCQLYEEF